MTLDQLQQRDARIAELETIARDDRTDDQAAELRALHNARDIHWRRLPRALAAARTKAATLDFYARQIGLPL